MNTQQALQLAFQHLNSGNLVAAGQLFNSVLQDEPQNFAALNGRGFVALQRNLLPQAQADLQASLSINPKQPFAYKMVGIVLGAMGQFESSMQAFAAALALDARDPEVYFNRANFRFQAGHVEEALADLDAAVKLKASYLEARSNRANLLIQLGDFARAEKDLDYLVNKVTNNPDLWVALGLARYKVGKAREALQCNDRALRLVPNHPDALLNSSSVTHDQEHYAEALAWADKAVAATPQRAEAHYAQAQALLGLSRFESAELAYSRAIQLNENYAEAFMGRGLVRARLHQLALAVVDYDRAIALKPDYDEAAFNRGHAHLEHRDFVLGWQGYEHRFKMPSIGTKYLPDIPVWDGEAINGLLLVNGEQGLGDQVLFGSVLPDLIQSHPDICVRVEPRLVSLFQSALPSSKVISLKDPVPKDVAAQIALGSLPQFFRKTETDFLKAKRPILSADNGRAKSYREVLAPNGERVVGVNWRSFRNKYADDKSIHLKDLLPIFQLPGCVFVNLQYGDTAKELAEAKALGIQFSNAVAIDLTHDLEGVAALIDACDVVVSVSNSTAHIAGALGKDVRLLLPFRTGKLWYWSEAKGQGSLWYPTVHTFHQGVQGDWASTIDAVKASLLSKV